MEDVLSLILAAREEVDSTKSNVWGSSAEVIMARLTCIHNLLDTAYRHASYRNEELKKAKKQ